MQPLAADLREEDMHNLADYYARLTPPREESKSVDTHLVERGRKLAFEGARDSAIPPCMACHANPGSAPRLAGQHAAYLAGQLKLWRMGHVPATGGAPLMAPVAQRLSDDQIDAVSAYLSTVPQQMYEVLLH